MSNTKKDVEKMNYTKKQHYVPQFYLKRFCQSKDKINVYLKDKDKFLRDKLIRNIAYENDYLDINLEKLKDNSLENDLANLKELMKHIDFKEKDISDYAETNNIENFYSELESLMGVILHDFDGFVLNEKREYIKFPMTGNYIRIKICIILFIIIQYVRQPMYRDRYVSIYNKLFDDFVDYGIKEKIIKKDNTFLTNIKNKEIAKGHHISRIGKLDNYNAMIECIGSMSCDIIINETETPFVTSDSPVCALKKYTDNEYVDSIFKISECNLIIFPLSNQVCLVFEFRFLDNDWYMKHCKDLNKIKEINTIIFECSKEQVYMSSDKLDLVEFIKVKPIELVVDIK